MLYPQRSISIIDHRLFPGVEPLLMCHVVQVVVETALEYNSTLFQILLFTLLYTRGGGNGNKLIKNIFLGEREGEEGERERDEPCFINQA